MQDHFKYIFWYIVGCTAFVLIYQMLITFLPIPAESIRFADTGQGFLLGTLLGSGVMWLIGGSPIPQKKTKTGATTAEVTAVITQEPEKEDQDNG